MVLAGIKVTDTHLVRDAMDLARSFFGAIPFNHVMRSWLFSVLLSEDVKPSPDPELLAVFHRFTRSRSDRPLHGRGAVRGRCANAARAFLKERGIATLQLQLVWDAIALHTTRSIALHKEPEVAMTHSGIAVDAIGLVSIEFRRINYRRSSRRSLAWRSRTSSSHLYATSFAANRRPALTTFFGISAPATSKGSLLRLRGRRRKLAVF